MKQNIPLIRRRALACRPGAWTLVELLIAVGIVAVLAALAFPIMRNARVASQLAVSIQHVRRLQMGNQQYSADHTGWYISALSAENIPWYRNPVFRRYFELNNPGEVYYWPDKFLSPRATLNRRGSEGLMNQSYGYNVTGLGAIDVTLGIADYRINSAALANPGQTLAFADALDWWIVRQSADRYNGVEASLVQAIAYRYPVKGGDPRNGKAAVVYFDGHGEALGRDQVVGNSRLWNISK